MSHLTSAAIQSRDHGDHVTMHSSPMAEESDMIFTGLDPFLGVFSAALSISIVASNGALIVGIWRLRKRKLNTHILVLFLAINDLVVGLVVIPNLLPPLFSNRQNLMSEAWCATTGIVTSVTVTMSVVMVMHLTIDRFVAVRYPVRYRHFCTRGRMVGVVGVTWLGAIFFSIFPVLPGFGGYRFKKSVCLCLKRIGQEISGTFSNIYNALCVAFPMMMVVTFSCAMILELRRKSSVGKSNHARRAACITTLMIVGAYMLCVLPYTATFIAKNTLMHQVDNVLLSNVLLYCLLTTYCNSLLNPIIYVSRSSRMGHEVLAVAKETSSIVLFLSKTTTTST